MDAKVQSYTIEDMYPSVYWKKKIESECVSSVIIIEAVLHIDREKMGTLGILMRIDDGVYVWNCTVYSYISKQFIQHVFVYDSHFQQKRRVHAVVQ